jgi:hypothetical protein
MGACQQSNSAFGARLWQYRAGTFSADKIVAGNLNPVVTGKK